MSIMSIYIHRLNNRALGKAYRHVIHLDLYAEQFMAAAISCVFGAALTYLAGCLTSGNPWALALAVAVSVYYGWQSIASVDTLVLNEWRARAWVS